MEACWDVCGRERETVFYLEMIRNCSLIKEREKQRNENNVPGVF